MNYREKRRIACNDLFSGFVPDVSNARNPELVLLIAELFSEGFYSYEIADTLGKTPKSIQKTARRYNFPDMSNFYPPLLDERKDWKGGKKMMKGYLYRRCPSHPNGTKHGNYVAEHRLVVEKKIGRFLLTTEVVDHIDGDITNNSPENLRVFASNGEHLRETLKGKCPNWSDDGKRRISEGATLQWKRYREAQKA